MHAQLATPAEIKAFLFASGGNEATEEILMVSSDAEPICVASASAFSGQPGG